MKRIILIAHLLMGAILTLAGAVYFLGITPQEEMSGAAGTFITGLFSAGYMLPLVKLVELVCGLALLSGQFVTLATVVIFPITLNIFLYNAFLQPKALVVAILLLAINLFIAYANKDKYALILARK